MTVNSDRWLNFIAVLSLTAICSLAISFAREIFPLYEPDSSGYISFSPLRTSFYPALIQLAGAIFDYQYAIVIIQVALYLISFAYLLWVVQTVFASYLVTLPLGLGIGLNIYLQAYHTVILTESLAFSLCNFLLALLVKGWLARGIMQASVVGLVAGSMLAFRPALASFVVVLLVALPLFNAGILGKTLRNIIGYLLSVMVVLSLESAIYFSHHSERQSLSSLTLLGKGAILTTYADFKYPTLSEHQNRWLKEIDRGLHPVQLWLESDESFILRTSLRSNFEVFAQYQLVNMIASEQKLSPLSDEEFAQLGMAAVRTNPYLYVKSSLHHLYGLWLAHEVSFLRLAYDQKLPLFESSRLNSALPGQQNGHAIFSVEAKSDIALLSFFVFPAFLLLGIASLGLAAGFWLFLGLRTVRGQLSSVSNDVLVIALLLLLGWSNLVLVASTNIATPRYLMPNMPFFILAFLLFLKLSLLTIAKNKGRIKLETDKH